MQALIRFFVELCALRRAPQDLPASEVLFGLILVLDLVVGVLVGTAAGMGWWTSFLQGLAEIAITLAALSVALNQLGKRARFIQSATALLGSGVLLGILAILPLGLNPTGNTQSDLAALGAFLLLGLVIWGVVVSGHIVRHTFDLTLGQGAAIAVAFEIFTVTLVTAMLGG